MAMRRYEINPKAGAIETTSNAMISIHRVVTSRSVEKQVSNSHVY